MITLKNVSVHYPIQRKVDPRALADVERAVGGQIVIIRNKPHVLALDRINLSLPPKSVTGLIGVNGSGKSTLLRVIAQILPISTGTLRVDGQISTLFSRNVGLDGNLSGRENVKLAAALYNLRSAELPSLMEDVQQFTELGPYFDMPVKSYSSGMSARFGFAIATAVHADIILIDELIGAGDIVFKERAKRRFDDVISRAGTLIIASHNRDLLLNLCDRVIWLDHGQMRSQGAPEAVLREFHDAVTARRRATPGAAPGVSVSAARKTLAAKQKAAKAEAEKLRAARRERQRRRAAAQAAAGQGNQSKTE